MAIRAASIWRAVTQPASIACSPKSPNETFAPRVATPRRRPRCCFLNLTFFGIIMMRFLLREWGVGSGGWKICLPHPTPHTPHPNRVGLLRTSPASRFRHLALEDPHLDADDSVRRLGQGQTVIDVGLERVQRKASGLVPLGARDFGAVQAPTHADFDALRAEAEGRFHGLLHGAPECDAALQLRGNVLGHKLSIERRTLAFLDVDVALAFDHLLQPI